MTGSSAQHVWWYGILKSQIILRMPFFRESHTSSLDGTIYLNCFAQMWPSTIGAWGWTMTPWPKNDAMPSAIRKIGPCRVLRSLPGQAWNWACETGNYSWCFRNPTPYHPWGCYIYLHEWLILMVLYNVGKYTIHESYGYTKVIYC